MTAGIALVLSAPAVAQHPKTVKAPVVVPSYLDRHK
jgi:hypothetical protein